MPTPEIVTGLVLKMIGSVCGTILALVFSPPRNRREFRRRASFSLIAGVALTPVATYFLPIGNDPESLVATACGTAFVSWWVAGTLRRVIAAWNPPAD
jgi:hypothetical protein